MGTERNRQHAREIIAELEKARLVIRDLYAQLHDVTPDEDLLGLPAGCEIVRELRLGRDLVIGHPKSKVWHHFGWTDDDSDCGLAATDMVVVSRDGRRLCKLCAKP